MFRQPLGALIFFIAATAEANRTPFDLTEADSEIVAGFATEYSGMRFGFLFFAEYVNVFIVSALHRHAVLRGVERAAPVPAHRSSALDPGVARHRAAVTVAVVPVALTLLFALPFYLTRNRARLAGPDPRLPAVQRRGIGGLLFGLAYIDFDWVAGLVWFMVKTFMFVFVFVWMRGTLPRVRSTS